MLKVLKHRKKVRFIIGDKVNIFEWGMRGNSYPWPLNPETAAYQASMNFCKNRYRKYALRSEEQRYWIASGSIKSGQVKFQGYLAELPLDEFLSWPILQDLVETGQNFNFLFTDVTEAEEFSKAEFNSENIWSAVKELALTKCKEY